MTPSSGSLARGRAAVGAAASPGPSQRGRSLRHHFVLFGARCISLSSIKSDPQELGLCWLEYCFTW